MAFMRQSQRHTRSPPAHSITSFSFGLRVLTYFAAFAIGSLTLPSLSSGRLSGSKYILLGEADPRLPVPFVFRSTSIQMPISPCFLLKKGEATYKSSCYCVDGSQTEFWILPHLPSQSACLTRLSASRSGSCVERRFHRRQAMALCEPW